LNSSIFQFKQFEVDQTHCAMKVNTDGVLLGAWAEAEQSQSILDIGTGTGVISLMLAQRFPDAAIDAVELDKLAATTAAVNFQASPFANRLKAFPLAIEHYWMVYPDKKFDLIVSNPPFFLDSLKSAEKTKELARHTNMDFFEELCASVAQHLNPQGKFCLILPLETAELVKNRAMAYKLYPQRITRVCSFEHAAPHRFMLRFGLEKREAEIDQLIIYQYEKVYHIQYQNLLKNFLTIF